MEYESSDREEGELSGEEGEPSLPPHKIDLLCPPELYQRVLVKSAAALDLEVSPVSSGPNDPSSRVKSNRQGSSKPLVVPFPEQLDKVFASEWGRPMSSKHSARFFDKRYTLPAPIMDKLRVPVVDGPVVALCSPALLPSEGEGGPKESCDKRIDLALLRNFEASSQGFRVAVTNSIFSRAAYIWAEELASDPSLPGRVRSSLKKIALATAASADCAYDSLELAGRSMATGVVARRNVWLSQWQGDAGSATRLVSSPFKGQKLFGESLEPLLVEDKDKRKVLLSSKKEAPKKTPSFRPSGFRSRDGWTRSKPKWGKGKAPFKSRQGTSNSSQGTKGTKEQ